MWNALGDESTRELCQWSRLAVISNGPGASNRRERMRLRRIGEVGKGVKDSILDSEDCITVTGGGQGG